MDNTEYLQDGYIFYSQKEAQAASLDSKRIEYLEAKMDYSKPENVLQIYNRAIKDNIFQTQVGLNYLKKLQDYLYEQGQIDKTFIADIPVNTSKEAVIRDQAVPARRRIAPVEEKKSGKAGLTASIIINIALAVAIIAMFAISISSDQPNILNYEKNIQNRYAEWEQELTRREQIVREKERELRIEQEIAQE